MDRQVKSAADMTVETVEVVRTSEQGREKAQCCGVHRSGIEIPRVEWNTM